MRITFAVFLILFTVSPPGISAPQDGLVEGALDPPDSSARVAALRDNRLVATTLVEGSGGKFRMSLTGGTYTIMVSAPISSFPVRLDNVIVRAGETTMLPTVLIIPGSGKAILSGRVFPPQPDSEIMLYAEGRERATVRTDREGRYEFRELPAGEYEVRASAPGRAQDRAPVVIPENQRVRQTSVLLPLVPVDGVDWDAGRIRATGVGQPPQSAANTAQARALAQRAAIADAQRNILRTIEQIKVDGHRSVMNIMSTGNGRERIQGFVSGATVVHERTLVDGRIEVTLELPLTGHQGLSRFLIESDAKAPILERPPDH